MAATVSSLPSAWGKPGRGGEQDAASSSSSCVAERPPGCAESCLICRAEVVASVVFRPCGHKMCLGCVEQTRARNIYKADKGVKCPFCRQYVEEFVPLTREAQDRDVLLQANAAAAKAAAARAPEESAALCGDSSMSQRRWRCLHCNHGQNSGTTEMCDQCGRLKPELVVPQPPKGKDLLKYSTDEIIAACQAKWHPNLNKAFVEAGVPISIGKVQGDEDSISAALKKNGQKKLVMIVRTLAGSQRLYELCRNMFGNYTVQDLMDAMAKLRKVAENSSKHDVLHTAVEDLTGSNSGFGLMLNSLVEDLCDMSLHPTCFYVVQRLISLCTLDELCIVTSAILPRCMEVASSDKGCHVVHNLLEMLNDLQGSVVEDSKRMKARASVNDIAGALHGDFRLMSWMATHSTVGGKIFLHVLLGALPAYRGVQVGSFLASYAHDLVQTKNGMKTVLGILSLQGNHIREVMRDLVCCIALSLQGNMAAYTVCEPVDAQQLVQVLIQRLVDEGEVAWVDMILEELVAHGEDLLENEIGRDVLIFTLSLNIIQHQTAEMFTKKLAAQGLDVQALQDIVMHNRQETHQDDEHTKPHWGASIISPWLKFHIESGNDIVPPPPPPTSPGHEFVELSPAQPPPPTESRHTSPSTIYTPGDCSLKGSIWTENSGFAPDWHMPPPPQPFPALSPVPENGYSFEQTQPSAKLPADLMECVNSVHTEVGTPSDPRCGVVEFSGISAPPPAMYRYPGNWHFPDAGDTEQIAADLDVTEVINQFQDTTLTDSRTSSHVPAIYRPPSLDGSHVPEDSGSLGTDSRTRMSPSLPAPLQRLLAPMTQAGGNSTSHVTKGLVSGDGVDNSDSQHTLLWQLQGAGDGSISAQGADGRQDASGNSPAEEGEQKHCAWTCHLCTYEHKGPEAEYLTCSMCGSTKGQNSYVAGHC